MTETNWDIGVELTEILPRLRLFARSRVFSEAGADDLVQETCLRVIDREQQFDADTNLLAWSITIMKHIQIDSSRSARNRYEMGSADDILDRPDPLAVRAVESRLELNEVHIALHKLPEEQREVLALMGGGFSYREISEAMGIPMGTVMSRLARGRVELSRLTDRNMVN